MQLIRGDFVRLVPKPPAETSLHGLTPRLIGGILVVAGAAIVARKWLQAGAAAAGTLLVAVLYLRWPEIAGNPGAGFVWTNPCKTLALLGGVLLIAGFGLSAAARLRTGRTLLAIFLLVAGVQHFVYAGFVHTLVPAWLPAPPFWTYFTGVALFAGGLGLLWPRTARAAGAWSGLMIFLWVFLLHLPRAFAGARDPGEMAGVFEALALSGVALLASGPSAKE
jgi:uncharacterized membrane protein